MQNKSGVRNWKYMSKFSRLFNLNYTEARTTACIALLNKLKEEESWFKWYDWFDTYTYINIWAVTCDFQQCGILTSVETQTGLCSLLLSLETPFDVQLVA